MNHKGTKDTKGINHKGTKDTKIEEPQRHEGHEDRRTTKARRTRRLWMRGLMIYLRRLLGRRSLFIGSWVQDYWSEPMRPV